MLKDKTVPFATPHVSEDEVNAAVEVIRSGWWTTGPKVTQFEEAICNYLKANHGVALNSCTAGLYLVLKALNIGEGDEVIVPTWTFAATAQVVEWAGARPVLCDVEKSTLNLDVKKARDLITRNTKAVIPVHMASLSADMEALLELKREYSLFILEDAAHSMGAEYQGKKTGSFGDAAVFSFYVTKNLACGEGGMLVTPHKELADKVRRLSYFGINKTPRNQRGAWHYEIQELGYKFNMDSLHAAIGLIQLSKLDWMNGRRQAIADRYLDELKNVEFFQGEGHRWHLFIVKLPENTDRDWVIQELKQRGVGTSVHYIPLHLHPHYQNMGDFPVATSLYERVLSLPMCPSMEEEDVSHVIQSFNEIIKRAP